MELSSGRTVKERPMANGAKESYMTPGNEEMTHAEWAEYCAKCAQQAKVNGTHFVVG